MAKRAKRKTASTEALEKLHDTLALVLAAGITEKDADGKRNAALINVARQFLKDNGIQVATAPPDSPMGQLIGNLPEFDPDEDELNRGHTAH